jgi:signal transduction histidine kinase
MDALDALAEAVFIVRDENVAWANRRAAALLGREQASLAGVPIEQVVRSEDFARLRARLLAGRDDPLWLRLVRSDGEEITVDARGAALAGEQGSFVVSAVAAPHTARLELLLAGLGEALGSTDAEGVFGFDAVITGCSAVFRELGWFGTLFEVQGGGAMLTHFIAPDESLEVYRRAQSLYGRRVPFEQVPNVARVARTGEARFIDDTDQAAAALFRERGLGSEEVQAVAQSITERRLTRGVWAPVKTSPGALTHVLTVIGPDLTEADFTTVMVLAHHLGAVLRLGELSARLVEREGRAVSGVLAAVIAQEAAGTAGALLELGEALSRVTAAADAAALAGRLDDEAGRLRRLIDQLHAFAAPAAGGTEPVSLDEALRTALGIARAGLAGDRPQPAVELDLPATPLVVTADAARLRHALAHLLSNALDRAKSRVVVRAEPAAGGMLRLRVEDDGPPLPADAVERIFEPFAATGSDRAGLGLSAVRQVVEELGGRITLERSGAAFSIVLPLGG